MKEILWLVCPGCNGLMLKPKDGDVPICQKCRLPASVWEIEPQHTKGN